MRNPEDLTCNELEQIVVEVRAALYLEVEALNPEKCWDADTCQDVAEILHRYALAPESIEALES